MAVARGVLAGALIAVATLAGGVPAHAAERVAVTHGPLVGGVTLAGNRVVWEDSRCLQDCPALDDELFEQPQAYRFRVAGPGRRAVVIGRDRFDTPEDGGEGDGDSASSTSLRLYAFAGDWMVRADSADYSEDDAGRGVRRIDVGRIGPRLPELFRCTFGDRGPELPLTFALDRGRLVYQRSPCATGRPALAVRDLRTGRERPVAQPVGGRLDPSALRGPFVLARRFVTAPDAAGGEEPAGLRLIRWPTGRLVADLDPGRFPDAADVQADGTVATIRAAEGRSGADKRCHGTVELWRPPGYRPRAVAHGACGALRLEQGVATFDAARPQASIFLPPREIRQVGIGGRPRTIARFGRDESSYGFDADGRYVTFGIRRCDRSYSILRLRQGQRAYRSPRSLSCPVRFDDRTMRVRGKRAAVRVRCPRACKGALFLVRRGRRLAAGRLEIRGSRIVSTRLTARGAALLRHHRIVHGTLRAVVLNRGDRRATYTARGALTR